MCASVEEFIAKYGPRPDTAAKRKALSEGRVPAELVPELEAAIEASGVPISQTTKGWGAKEIFEAVRAELEAAKRK